MNPLNSNSDNNHQLEEPKIQQNKDTTIVDDTETIEMVETEVENQISDTSEVNSAEIDGIIKPDITDEVIFPTYSLFRNKDRNLEVLKFQPGDLITLILENTGTSKSTEIAMFDSRDEPRFHGKSGGHNHEWTTRIQRTTILGNWRFTAQGPFIDENNLFSIDIPFELVNYIEEVILEAPEEVIISVDQPEDDYKTLIDFAITEKVHIPVIEIKGVGPSYQKRMNDSGVHYFHEILQSPPSDLSDNTAVNLMKVEMWFAFVEKVLRNREHQLVLKYSSSGARPDFNEEAPSKIKGIGPIMERKLVDAGYINIKSIAQTSTDELVERIQVTVNKAQKWIDGAQELLISDISDQIAKPSVTAKVKDVIKLSDTPDKILGVGPATVRKLSQGGFNTIIDIIENEFENLVQALNSDKRAKKILDGALLIQFNLLEQKGSS